VLWTSPLNRVFVSGMQDPDSDAEAGLDSDADFSSDSADDSVVVSRKRHRGGASESIAGMLSVRSFLAAQPPTVAQAAARVSDAVDRPAPRVPSSSGTNKVSTRSLEVDVAFLRSTYLGKPVPFSLAGSGAQAKAACIVAACASFSGSIPCFNKLSGVIEWANAVCLFVNVGGDDYDNVFVVRSRGSGDTPGGSAASETMVRMTWFAQSSHTETSPVIARLIGASTVLGAANQTPVLLFCRIQGQPYVYCGQLEYVTHCTKVQPLSFVWELNESTQLLQSPAFVELVNAVKE
jgi:hypothetical protein